MNKRNAITRHNRRSKPHGNPASTLIADYIAAHPSCKPATWSQAKTQDHLPTQPIPAITPQTNPVLSILRPTVASL